MSLQKIAKNAIFCAVLEGGSPCMVRPIVTSPGGRLHPPDEAGDRCGLQEGLVAEVRGAWSRENFPHHLAIDIGEAEIATLVSPDQFLMVESQQVQDGGVEVVEVDLA